MIDLPDYGYTDRQITHIDPAGVVQGSLGGPADIIDRPGLRYAVQFTIPMIPSSKEGRIFESLLEQGARQDVSYPFPLDFKALPAGAPVVNGASAAGANIPIRGLTPNYQIRQGQALAVISAGIRFIHKARVTMTADGTGAMVLPVFPYTRKSFLNGDTIEIERPRIGGVLSWQGGGQSSFGARGFTFTISERY